MARAEVEAQIPRTYFHEWPVGFALSGAGDGARVDKRSGGESGGREKND